VHEWILIIFGRNVAEKFISVTITTIFGFCLLA